MCWTVFLANANETFQRPGCRGVRGVSCHSRNHLETRGLERDDFVSWTLVPWAETAGLVFQRPAVVLCVQKQFGKFCHVNFITLLSRGTQWMSRNKKSSPSPTLRCSLHWAENFKHTRARIFNELYKSYWFFLIINEMHTYCRKLYRYQANEEKSVILGVSYIYYVIYSNFLKKYAQDYLLKCSVFFCCCCYF